MAKKKGTDVILTEFKGNEIACIIEVDEEGKQINERPVISFGKKKLKAILENVDKLREVFDKM